MLNGVFLNHTLLVISFHSPFHTHLNTNGKTIFLETKNNERNDSGATTGV